MCDLARFRQAVERELDSPQAAGVETVDRVVLLGGTIFGQQDASAGELQPLPAQGRSSGAAPRGRTDEAAHHRPDPLDRNWSVQVANRWAEQTVFVPDDAFSSVSSVDTGVSLLISVVRVVDRFSTENREGEEWRSLTRVSQVKALPEMSVEPRSADFLVDDSVVRVRCVDCGGSGSLRCSSCGGHGSRACQRRERCSRCFGTGRDRDRRCSRCLGEGAIVCRKCQGRGSISCARCGGDGLRPCQRCTATGTVTQYRIRNWRRELLTEGRQVMGRDLPGGGGKWRRLVECPIDEAGLHLRDEEMVSLHRLMLDRKMEESPGMVFVLLEALPWAAIWTEKAGRQDGAIETLVLGDQSPRVVSPALQEQAKKQRWAAILIGVAIVVALLVIVLLVL